MEATGFNISLIGGAHKQNGKPMQDRSATRVGSGYSIAVVCDGHGANKHFRSHIGAEIACETAVDKLTEFVTAYPTYDSAMSEWGQKSERLRLSIVSEWINRISAEHQSNPFTESELTNGIEGGGDYFSRYTKFIPYGTTLLAVLLARDYYLALMIGDGVIIRMTPEGEAVEEAFEGKELSDRVDSMCNRESAFKLFAKCVRLEEADKDTAFVLCTDGFCESEAFTSREIMRNWPKKYLAYWAEHGFDTAMTAVTKQLAQVSDYSMAQDDISIAIAVRDVSAYLPVKAAEGSEDGSSAPEQNKEATESPENTTEATEEAAEANSVVKEAVTEEGNAAEDNVTAPSTESSDVAQSETDTAGE